MPQPLSGGKTSSPRLCGIILAAGLSRRAAPKNKLLLPGPGGLPVVRCVAAAFCEAGLGEVIVVTGHQRGAIEHAVSGLPLRTVFAADFASGMGHSLAAGVRAASLDCRGFLICPGDLPGMNLSLVTQVAYAFAAHDQTKNIIPTHGGSRGHPVALVSDLRASLENLSGDQGARVLLSTEIEKARTVFLSLASDAIHTDNDAG
jgi:molybdenum cofactor cytidylyltransferase